MTSQDFRNKYPEFKHRLVVKKTYNNLQPISVEIGQWLINIFGDKGCRWRYQPMAHPDYLVYWFVEERDLAWAQLRWS